jgi:hypothetical protein
MLARKNGGRTALALLMTAALAAASHAQDQWPMSIDAEGTRITVYTPQPESYKDGEFTARAAVSVMRKTDKEPVFGAIWTRGFLEVDRNTRMGTLTRLSITDVRFPTALDSTKLSQFKDVLVREIPKRTQRIAIDRLVAALDMQVADAEDLKNDPPEIIYRDKPTVLVYMDGEPIYEAVGQTGYDRVLNCPRILVRNAQGRHYLYAASVWTSSTNAKGPYSAESQVPADLRSVSQRVDSAAKADGSYVAPYSSAPEVIVRTTAAELVQTTGSVDMRPITGTRLLYADNTDNILFMDIASQEYFLLLSGRWFASKSLASGPWRFVPGEKLPADFALIPEGSDRDLVLASVPGTKAATEAVRDAQIPQTAAVDRKNVALEVSYKGDPQWEKVDGTTMSYAINASTTVLKIDGHYHVCDNGVWYEGAKPNGPWSVSTEVPKAVSTIPSSSPVSNVKYVQIYDATPEVVYVGYTPGYTGSYVYGGVVVYGSGWYYPPPPPMYYYPRPSTWGFSMHYNPWTGWSMGLSYNVGWFHFSTYGGSPWGCHYGGWWGPPVYHPPYHHPPYHGGGGYYGQRPSYGGRPGGNTINVDNSTNININRGNNIYGGGQRPGVKPSTADAGARPGTSAGTRPTKDVFTDPSGNVFRGDHKGTEKYNGSDWNKVQRPAAGGTSTARPGAPSTAPTPSRPAQAADPMRIQQDRARGQERSTNFQQRPSMPPPRQSGGAASMPAGGARPAARPMPRGR